MLLMIKKLELCLLVVLTLFRIKIGNVHISVPRIAMLMSKTAYINPGSIAKYFGISLSQTYPKKLIKFISRAAYTYTRALNTFISQASHCFKMESYHS